MVIPELNPEMDVYRIGTLLEMVREIAMAIAQDGKKVKVCVQQPLGEGFFTVRPPPVPPLTVSCCRD
jgi:adenylate kinase